MGDSGTLKIWHKVKHDDYCVTEVPCIQAQLQIDAFIRQGGFWSGGTFVPYHSISAIEFIEVSTADAR